MTGRLPALATGFADTLGLNGMPLTATSFLAPELGDGRQVRIRPLIQEEAMGRRHRSTVGRDLVKGAIAGAVATWVMGKVTNYLYEREDPSARSSEDEARGGKTAYGAAAEKTARLFGKSLDQEPRERLGSAIHWALGIGTGAVYAVVRRRFDRVGKLGGTGFGTAFWVLVDEGLVSMLGLTPAPPRFPWQTHARGLAGHLTFGTVTDATLRALEPIG